MQPVKPLAFPEFVVMLAMLFATVAFSIDAMLPSLADIARELSPQAVNRAQLVVTSFVLGMGFGTLIAGPLADSFGRKRMVVLGMGIYCVAALVAAQAQSLEVLLAARLAQGLGAAGPRVVTLAMVRDLYSGRLMARVMSFVMTVFIFVPVVAPTVGAWIAGFWGWRAVFLSFVVFGLIAGSWVMLRQPETLPVHARRPLRLRPVLAALREVLASRLVMLTVAALSLGFGQMFIFLSTLPQIFEDIFGRGHSFHYWFALMALAAGTSGLVNASLVMRLGMRVLARAAFATQAILSLLALVVFTLVPLPPGWDFAVFFVYMSAAFFMIGLTFGNLNALALEPMGHIAGMASAVVGSISTIGAVIVAVPVAILYNGTLFPLLIGVLVCSGLAFLLLLRLPPEVQPAVG